jgi:hypothetical protein
MEFTFGRIQNNSQGLMFASKICMTEEKIHITQQQIAELFQPGTNASDFTTEVDDLNIDHKIKRSQERQESILKQKEVNEDLLRKVVKL